MVGNIPNFAKTDILRCFLRFSRNAGRKDIAREMEFGEGTIRTILKILKSKKLLDSTKKGHFLSKSGAEALSQISARISMPKKVVMQNLYPDLKKMGILIRNAPNLKEIYKLRDIAVKHGADGAVILKFDGRLRAPESGYEQEFRELEKHFDLKDNDALVISFSGRSKDAENGALAIAVELDEALKKFINQF